MRKRKVLFNAISVMFTGFMLAGCAHDVSPNTYQAAEVGVVGKVVSGVIAAKRAVNINTSNGVGGIAGAAAGAAAGSALGGSIAGHVAGAVGGAVIAGVLGNAIDKGINHRSGYEYIIKLKDGGTISVVQAADMQFVISQHVLVIYGAMTRIVPDTTN